MRGVLRVWPDLAAGEVDLPADQLDLGRGVGVEQPDAAGVPGAGDGPPTARPQSGETGATSVKGRLDGADGRDLLEKERGVVSIHTLANDGPTQLTTTIPWYNGNKKSFTRIRKVNLLQFMCNKSPCCGRSRTQYPSDEYCQR